MSKKNSKKNAPVTDPTPLPVDGITKVMETATLSGGATCDFPMLRVQVGELVELFSRRKKADAWYKEQKFLAKSFLADKLISRYVDRLNELDVDKIPPWKKEQMGTVMDAMVEYLNASRPTS